MKSLQQAIGHGRQALLGFEAMLESDDRRAIHQRLLRAVGHPDPIALPKFSSGDKAIDSLALAQPLAQAAQK